MMKLSGEQIKERRLKLTGPILERIHHKVVIMMQDAKIMANELMRNLRPVKVSLMQCVLCSTWTWLVCMHLKLMARIKKH